ncbi:hypothetical protein DFH08DRAFT_820279 [Mycena albidolilacea]|uniref:Uncharacterized protein n=1 Tax=Mycena albidolilacea TaxID=1033008 RepID=A0AAD6ZDG0_9AGAR|nr:hypothetical protein DFH08DRAFT_820279 [Mycena albidolilacea]
MSPKNFFRWDWYQGSYSKGGQWGTPQIFQFRLQQVGLPTGKKCGDAHIHFLQKACARFVALEAQEVFHNLKSPPIHPKPRPAFQMTHKSVSPLTSPEMIAAAGPTTIIESQTPISAQPPQKRLNLGPLKGWGVQHDGVSLSTVVYAQNYQDKFNKEYAEYAKAVLPTDLD